MARVTVTAIALLFTWQTVTYEGAVGNCANGFIQQDLLRTLVSSGSVSNTRLDNELRLIPDWNFTCSGTITSFLVGADIRISGTLYPEVQIWRKTNLSSSVREYTKVWSEMVRLDPGYFSPSGVLEYRLNNSFNFQTGDIFGVYQPPLSSSVVRIYYKNNDNTAPVAYRRTGSNALGSNYNIDSGFTIQWDQFLLISPVTDSPCASAFLNSTALQQKAYDVKLFNDRRRFNQRVFPDINFTCSGNLTKWIVGGTVGSAAGGEVQIWRRNNGSDNDYTKVGYSILNATDPDGDCVYEHIPDPPLQFQEGDILGVYQQQGSGRMRVYYQLSTGPANYRYNLNINPPVPSTLNNPTLVPQQYDYPLVTVEIISASTPTSSFQAPSETTSSMFTQTEDNPHTLSMSTTITMSTALVSDTRPTSSAEIMITTGPSQLPAGGVSAAAVGGAIVVLLIILALFAAAVIAIPIVVIVRRRNSKKSTTLNGRDAPPIENPLYTSQVYTGTEERPGESCYLAVELYAQTDNNVYDECCSNGNVVHERRDKGDEYYSTVQITQNEEPLYWTPADDCSGIYEQLSSKGFRELTSDKIQTTTTLGSGHFGCVNKGVWYSPEGQVDVAIKTLKGELPEEELIKFLQEAAIMGQFHHPNIVKLHGVVTMGEPVMIVLELMNQDLRDHLFTLRPTSGEMAPSSLPQQLLEYCRQIASGMEYLSKKSFVHRDLAARNILVDDERTCKIADFGMSRDLENENYYTSRGGMIPMKWTAIEAILYKKYSTASDVWSFGVLMYEIWSLGHKPFEEVNNPKAVEMVRNGVRLSPPPGCPRAIYELMIRCWNPETVGRPTFAALVSRLSQPTHALLKWTGSEQTHTMLGAPLETASNLHSDLQQQYLE